MFRIEITGDAPGTVGLVHAYEDQALAERIAEAIVSYLGRNKLPDHEQGVQVLNDHGQWVWRQTAGSKPERLH